MQLSLYLGKKATSSFHHALGNETTRGLATQTSLCHPPPCDSLTPKRRRLKMEIINFTSTQIFRSQCSIFHKNVHRFTFTNCRQSKTLHSNKLVGNISDMSIGQLSNVFASLMSALGQYVIPHLKAWTCEKQTFYCRWQPKMATP